MTIRRLSGLITAGLITNTMLADNAVDASKLDETDDYNFTGALEKDGAALGTGGSAYYAVVDAAADLDVTLPNGAPDEIYGVSLSIGSKVLCFGQTAQAENGIYAVSSVGTGGDGVWGRDTARDTAGELPEGLLVYDRNKDTLYKLVTAPTTLGTDPVKFIEHRSGLQVANSGEPVSLSGANGTKTAFDLPVSGVVAADVRVNGFPQPDSTTSISAGTGAGGVDQLVFATAPVTGDAIEALIFFR
jgi:hypothetical protein